MKPEKKDRAIFFSRKVYSEEAVKLAAVVFKSRAAVRLARSAAGISAEVPGGEGAEGEFCNEVLNQQCRMDLGRKNSRFASILTTKALLSAAGVDKSGALRK